MIGAMPKERRRARCRGGTLRAALTVVVKPNAKSEAVTFEGGTVLVRVKEAAREGKANEACRRVLASALGVAPSLLTLVRGARAKIKVFAAESLTAEDITARIARLSGKM
jgi:uncharacterized protein YggU (UPF0235/DUF167 family)